MERVSVPFTSFWLRSFIFDSIGPVFVQNFTCHESITAREVLIILMVHHVEFLFLLSPRQGLYSWCSLSEQRSGLTIKVIITGQVCRQHPSSFSPFVQARRRPTWSTITREWWNKVLCHYPYYHTAARTHGSQAFKGNQKWIDEKFTKLNLTEIRETRKSQTNLRLAENLFEFLSTSTGVAISSCDFFTMANHIQYYVCLCFGVVSWGRSNGIAH